MTTKITIEVPAGANYHVDVSYTDAPPGALPVAVYEGQTYSTYLYKGRIAVIEEVEQE